jgi:hypothetical protein
MTPLKTILLSPLSMSSFQMGHTTEWVLKDKSNVNVRVVPFDCKHLPSIICIEHALDFQENPRGQQEVRAVAAMKCVRKLG